MADWWQIYRADIYVNVSVIYDYRFLNCQLFFFIWTVDRFRSAPPTRFMILRTWGKNRQSRLNLSPVCSRKRGLLPASNTCCGEANLKRAVESVVLRHFGNILASKLLPRIRCDPGGFGTVQTGKWVGKRKSRILIRRNVRKQTARTQNEIKAREAYFNRDANCWINLQVYAPPGDNLSAGYVTLYLKAEARRRKFFTVFYAFFFRNIYNRKLFSSVLFTE